MKAKSIRRLLMIGGLLFVGKAMAKPNAPDPNAWSKDDFVGKQLSYKHPDYNGSFRFETKHRQVVAAVGAGGGIALPCHWRFAHDRLELYEQEEIYWSFALLERKADCLVVKDNDGKVLELKIGS